MPPPGGVTVVEAPPRGLGPAQLVGRRPPAGADGARRALARRREDDADVVVVGYPGHFDMPAAAAAADPRLQPARLAARHAGRRQGALRPAPRRRASSAASTTSRSEAPISSSPTPRRTPPTSGRLSTSRPSVSPLPSSAPTNHCSGPDGTPEPFRVLFVGKLIPLHGVETILAATALLPDVPFRVVGDDSSPTCSRNGRPTSSRPWIPYTELPGRTVRGVRARDLRTRPMAHA